MADIKQHPSSRELGFGDMEITIITAGMLVWLTGYVADYWQERTGVPGNQERGILTK